MFVNPTGVFFVGKCDVQLEGCTAVAPAPITAVKTYVGASQINVCRNCLEQMVRDGQWEIEGAKVDRQVDILVEDSRNRPTLVVECKMANANAEGELRTRARQVRRNLLSHSGVLNAPFFMVVYYPTYAFLWSHSDSKAADAVPDYAVTLGDEIERIPVADTGNDYLNAEHRVAQWIASVLEPHPKPTTNGTKNPIEWLQDSGLLEATKGGNLREHAALAA